VSKPLGAVDKREARNLGEALGVELTRLRVARAWTQQKVSDMLGYDVAYIRQLEKGIKSPTLRTLSNFAAVYSLRVSVLLARAERTLERQLQPKRK
jgi:transcriptional regulator with XRE-family HTH domain